MGAPKKGRKKGPGVLDLQAGRLKEQRVASSLTKSGVKELKPWWVVDPRYNHLVGYWDLLTSVALVFTAIITPVEVSFMQQPEDKWSDGLFLVNRFVDLVFVCDMVLQFFLAYSQETRSEGLIWIFNPSKIAKHYVTSSWFVLDVVSIASSVPDIASIDGLSDLTALRVVRVLRLIKLVRVLRGSRLFKRWEIRFAIDYAMLELTKTFCMLLMVCHWFACIWGLQATFDPLASWPREKGFCEPWGDGLETSIDDFRSLDCPEGKVCDPGSCSDSRCTGASVCEGAWPMYMECLYVSAGTMTSGGAFTARFGNTEEKLLATMMILFSGVLWSQLIGVLCGIAANLSPAQAAFRKELSELNGFMTANPGLLDMKTRFRLREYLHQSVHMKNAQTQKRILSQLSPALHSEVVWKVTEKWLNNVRFLRDVEKEVLVALAFHVNAKVFPPEEICPHGVLYIVDKGIALYAGKIVMAGESWGEDLLMRDPTWVGLGHGIAVSYLWVYTLEGKVIKDCLALYPASERKVQLTNMRWMMARMMVRAGKIVKEFRRKMGAAATAEELENPFIILQKVKAERMEVSFNTDTNGVEAAKRYAAREAVRQAEAGTEADRISKLQTQMGDLMRIIEERLPPALPKPPKLPPAAPPRASEPDTGSWWGQSSKKGLLEA